jgi:hypothetical protein
MNDLMLARCFTTGNPCGTDTWGNEPCKCSACQRWILRDLQQAREEIEQLKAEALNLGGFVAQFIECFDLPVQMNLPRR